MESMRQLIEEYEINTSTMVVKPLLYGQKVFSKIFELEEDVISPFKPIDIIKESCVCFGSTFEGRKTATRKLLGLSHKVPISISPSIYFFPTTSPDNSNCIWIAQEHVIDYRKGEQSCTTVVKLKNKRLISVPISVNSFENQIVRTIMLRAKINKGLEKELFHHSPASYSSHVKMQQSAENRGPYHW